MRAFKERQVFVALVGISFISLVFLGFERRHKMRILSFFMVVCVVLTFGCAGMRPERSVLQDNIFYSSASPKIRIKINPDFKYADKAGKPLPQWASMNTGGITHCESESYAFLQGEKRACLITIHRLIGSGIVWDPDLFGREKNKLDSGVMKIQGKQYQYSVNIIDSPPSCILAKVFGRIVGPDRKTKIYVFYAEDIVDKYSCSDWINANRLTNEQEAFLKGFIDRSEKNIQILGKE